MIFVIADGALPYTKQMTDTYGDDTATGNCCIEKPHKKRNKQNTRRHLSGLREKGAENGAAQKKNRREEKK